MLWCILWNGVHGDDGHESCIQIHTHTKERKKRWKKYDEKSPRFYLGIFVGVVVVSTVVQ